MVRAFSMNPKVGFASPLRSRYILSRTLWHFHKNIRSCVENAVASAQLAFQILALLKDIYTTASIQKHGTANVWPW